MKYSRLFLAVFLPIVIASTEAKPLSTNGHFFESVPGSHLFYLQGSTFISSSQFFDTSTFDPHALAKLRIGELVEEIKQAERIVSLPQSPDLFFSALLLQAGLRALLPLSERQGVALPGSPNPKEPRELTEAQQNYAEVFRSGKEATPRQKAVARRAIAESAKQLRSQGYTKAADTIDTWLKS